MSHPNSRCLEERLTSILTVGLVLAGLSCAAIRGTQDTRPNILLICVDDLRPELGCYGVDYIHSPNIDELSERGRTFTRHFVQAPTCGASRYTMLTGTYGPAGNGALLQRGPSLKGKSLPGWFRDHGYETVSVGKVSHYPGGRAGKDWADEARCELPGAWTRHLMPSGPWLHPQGAMHGLAQGEIRRAANEMDVLQAFDGSDKSYPDGLITQEAINQLQELNESGGPFLLAVGLLKPHLPLGAPLKYLSPYGTAAFPPIPHPGRPSGVTTWHGSGEFMKYNRWGRNPNDDAEFALEVRRHYAACVSYADAMVGRLIDELDRLRLADETIVVLWGDHGWHLGEHGIWGKHALFEESLRSPLIICHPGLQQGGQDTRAIVESLDLFPTLCELAGIGHPQGLHGRSLLPILQDPTAEGRPAYSYTSKARTIRTDTHRLIAHERGHLELYDHTSSGKESENIAASHPGLANRLLKQLEKRLNLE